MRKSGFSVLSLVAGVCLFPAAAFAQEAPAAVAPAPAPAPTPATPAEPDHALPVAPVPDTAAAPVAPPPVTVAPAPAPADAAPAAAYPATTIGGGVEGSWSRMLGGGPHPGDTVAPTRPYDSSNGFLLNQASLSLKHQLNETIYGVIRFDAGANAAVNNFTSGTGKQQLFDVREAYAVAQGSGFTFTAGKFTTYQGIEVVDGWLNPTITRGFLYYLAEPVTHVGAKLHYSTPMFDVGVGVVNGWDTNNGIFYTGDNNPMKTLIWRLAATPSPMFFAAFSGTYGVEKAGSSDPRLSMDLTGAITPIPELAINFQGNYGTEKKLDWVDSSKSASWIGFGLQPVLKLQAFQLGARFEFFQDKGLSRTYGFSGAMNPKDADGNLEDPTNTKNKLSMWTFGIAPGYTIANALLMRAEFRVDKANEEVLWNVNKTQTSLTLSAAYYF
jgi:hypothetical protein